jgi:hypothetical protein
MSLRWGVINPQLIIEFSSATLTEECLLLVREKGDPHFSIELQTKMDLLHLGSSYSIWNTAPVITVYSAKMK